MDAPLYTFKLPTALNPSATHVAVLEESRNAGRFVISGHYGKVTGPTFEPAEGMIAYAARISDEDLEDLDIESTAAGRPASQSRTEMHFSDVAAWLEDDRAVIQARIEARRPEPEPEA